MALLDGLLNCYSPSLGPTGYRLIDRGPRKVHGTIPTANFSWAGDYGRWVVRGTNLSGSAITSVATLPLGDRAVGGWFRIQQTLQQFGAGEAIYIQGAGGAGQQFTLGLLNSFLGTTNIVVTQGGDQIESGVGNDNIWHLAVAANTGTMWYLWVDGILRASKSMTTNQVVGGAYRDIGLSWGGQLGEITLWNRVPTQAEIYTLYRMGDGAIGRMLTAQASQKRRLSIAIGAATTNRRRRIICGSQC